MRLFALHALLPLAFAGWLAAGQPADAGPPRINDETGLFDADTLERVNAHVREIRRKYGIDLVIDPVKTVPAEDAKRVKSLKSRDRDRYFADWVERRARDADLDGVLVLICKEPYRVQVHV